MTRSGIFSGIRRRLMRLRHDQSGATAILFAVLLPVLALVVGIAIDFGRASKERAVAGATLDATLLAVGRDLSIGAINEDDAPARVSAVFNELIAETSLAGTTINSVTTTVNQAAGRVDATVEGATEAAFGGLVGISSIDIHVNASVNYNTLTVELAMVLDVTGSMSGSKIADLKTAAKDLVNILLPINGSAEGKVRIALAPYSNSVNVGDYAEAVTGSASALCVTERGGTGDFDDTAPSVAQFPTTYSCPSVKITPLSGDRSALTTQIDSYGASGSTAGHIGIGWGWYMLSPDWNSVWPVASRPAAYGTKDLIKVLVVMTDGEFNTWYVNGNGNSSSQAKKICKQAKKEDVIIYTVAFQAPTSAQNLLKKCATSSDEHYFNATTGTALKDAFEAIAIQIRNLRLSS